MIGRQKETRSAMMLERQGLTAFECERPGRHGLSCPSGISGCVLFDAGLGVGVPPSGKRAVWCCLPTSWSVDGGTSIQESNRIVSFMLDFPSWRS